MKSPVETTGTLPKFNGVDLIFIKELMQFMENRSHMKLIWMGAAFKDLLFYGTLNTNGFLFSFLLFFLILFSFSLFYFPGKTMKKARDKKVT